MLVLPCEPLQTETMRRALEVLRAGGVLVYPTDTVYGMGCDLLNPQAIDKVYSLKRMPRRKPLSLICADLTQIADYALVPNTAFRLMKRLLPGPYTMVLQATRLVPRVMMTRQRTVGIRVPDHEVCLKLVRELGRPLVNTSASSGEEEAVSDPEQIRARHPQLDLLLDAGPLESEPSTILDLTRDTPVVLREGKGPLDAALSF